MYAEGQKKDDARTYPCIEKDGNFHLENARWCQMPASISTYPSYVTTTSMVAVEEAAVVVVVVGRGGCTIVGMCELWEVMWVL